MQSRSRNSVLAGIFVVASILLATAVIIVLADVGDLLTPKQRYIVRFSILDGAEGLKAGSVVKVGGQPVGEVTGWEFNVSPTGEPTAIDVEISIRADVKLFEDAEALLVLPLLGTTSTINIPWIGAGKTSARPGFGEVADQGTSRVLEPGEMLYGRKQGFFDQAGVGPEEQQGIKEIIQNVRSASKRLDDVLARVQPDIDPIMNDARAMVTDARQVVGDVRGKWPEWSGRVDTTLSSVEDASKKLPGIMENADKTLADARAGIEDVRTAVRDNRPGIDETVENVRQLTRKANTEGWERVQGVLARGESAVGEFGDVASRVNALLRTEAPQLREIVANARLASDQLKLTTAEVRAAPWKLLSKPTGRKDLENEALFDATRNYAIAVSDLKAATASLEVLAAAGGVSVSTPGLTAVDGAGSARALELRAETVKGLIEELKASTDRFQKAQQELLSRLAE